MIAFDDQALAQMLGATLVFIVAILGLYFQNQKVHRDNRADHQDTSKVVKQLMAGHAEMREDQLVIKTNVLAVREKVADLHDQVASHELLLREVASGAVQQRQSLSNQIREGTHQ